MFKKVLQSISKSLQRQGAPGETPAPAAKAEAAPAAARPEAKKAPVPEPKAESPLKKIAAVPAAPAHAPQQTAEELCGIDAKMNKDQIRERLKLLYRRHNRAASSLDPKIRAEADVMLDAIVAIREKTFGAI